MAECWRGWRSCRDARLAAAVLAAPGVRLTLSYAEQIAWPRLRKGMMGQRAAYKALNLTLAQPGIAKENILLLEGIHDLFVRSELIEELWQEWGAARHLAVAVRAHQLSGRGGLYRPRPSLAVANFIFWQTTE